MNRSRLIFPVRAGIRLTVYLVWTGLLLPLQILAVWRGLPLRASLPVFYHRWCAWLFDMNLDVVGKPVTDRPTLFVCNHTSYLDIVVLGALIDGCFVAKSEVANWPLFGTLAKLQRSVFVARDRRTAGRERDEMRRRLEAGDRLILFAEGTSGNGSRILPFRSALFDAVSRPIDGKPVTVQPVTIVPTHLDALPIGHAFRPLYTWYGDTELPGHLWNFAGLGSVTIRVEFHAPIDPSAQGSRKNLSLACHQEVAAGLDRARRIPWPFRPRPPGDRAGNAKPDTMVPVDSHRRHASVATVT